MQGTLLHGSGRRQRLVFTLLFARIRSRFFEHRARGHQFGGTRMRTMVLLVFFISGWVTSASAEDIKGTLETFLKAWGVDEGKVELIGATSAGGTTVYGLLVKARSKTESKIDLARKFTPIGMNELQYRQLISGNEVFF
jgi:hypothetical protein